MSTFSPALTGLIRLQHPVVSIQQLEAHGITRARRRSLFACGNFDVIHRGVYIVSTAQHTPRRGASRHASPTRMSWSAGPRRVGSWGSAR